MAVVTRVDDQEVTGNVVPMTPGTSKVGTTAAKFAEVNAIKITGGDIHLRDDERNAHWVLREETDRIVAINKITGRRYAIALTPIEEEKEE